MVPSLDGSALLRAQYYGLFRSASYHAVEHRTRCLSTSVAFASLSCSVESPLHYGCTVPWCRGSKVWWQSSTPAVANHRFFQKQRSCISNLQYLSGMCPRYRSYPLISSGLFKELLVVMLVCGHLSGAAYRCYFWGRLLTIQQNGTQFPLCRYSGRILQPLTHTGSKSFRSGTSL